MQPETPAAAQSRLVFWLSCVISAVPVLMLTMSAVMKITKPPEVMEGFEHLGWDETLALPLAITELACTVLYVIPQTAVLGALLLTGYLGGAIATHVRIHEQFIMPVAFGVLVWLGLYLRDARLRAILPTRK
jgi:hypothetical protein